MSQLASSPINVALLEHLQCVLLPGNEQRCSYLMLDAYNQAYRLWHSVVSDALMHEVKVKAPQVLYSDDFVRQKEIAVLFDQEKAVGMFAFSWFNLITRAAREHSYFTNYPQHLINGLIQQGYHNIMTMGQLVVDKDYRKSKIGIGVSELLSGFAVKRLLESHAEVAITFSRTDRKTEAIGYRYGAELLEQNHISLGLGSEIIAFYPDKVHFDTTPEITRILEKLWHRKTIAFTENLTSKRK